MLKSIAGAFIKVIFPPRCIFCGDFLNVKAEIEICSSCYSNIPFVNEDYNVQRMAAFRKGNIDHMVCLCRYSGIIKSSLIRFKFFNKPGYYRVFARLLAEQIKNMTNLSDIDIIISVPLHKKKKSMRGYNQSLLISRQLAKELGIAERSGILTRIRNTDSQSLLKKRSERHSNIKDAFTINNPGKLVDKTVLLVDDIATTGFTLEECGKVLKQAGAGKVIGAVIASGSSNAG